MIELRHQKQPTATTCVHACIAMIAGVPVADVVTELGEPGLSTWQTAEALHAYSIEFNQFVFTEFVATGWHLVTVPSLNTRAANHAILVHYDADEFEFVILDPCRGVEGKLFYGEGGQEVGSRSELLFVRPREY